MAISKSIPWSPKSRRGLRRLSPDVIGKARDETSAQISRIGLTFVGTTAFCLLCLLTPDSALLGGSEKITVPFAGPVSFFGFMLLGPAVLILLRIYLQIHVEHGNRLERLAQRLSVTRTPTLVPLHNPLIRLFSFLIFYALLPVAVLLFAWKAAVFSKWALALFSIAAGVIASHAMIPFGGWSWRTKGVASVAAAVIAGGIMHNSEPPHRSFRLFRANLSGQWLVQEDLRKAELGQANLRDAELVGADLRDAKLKDTNLSGAELFAAKLGGADLSHAILRGASLISAEAAAADFKDAILEGANLMSIYMPWAKLGNANLTQTNLQHAYLNDADLENANLESADLTRTDLTGAKLPGARLSTAKGLTQAQLNGACGNEATKLPEGLTVKPCK